MADDSKFDAVDVAMYIFWFNNLDRDRVDMAVKMFYDDATIEFMPPSIEAAAAFILEQPKYWSK